MDNRFDKYNELLPFYAKLLSERQKEILEYYYYEDFSLSEIAENLDISRNAVHDAIKKGEKALEQYESLLHLYENFKKRSKLYTELFNLEIEEVNKITDELKKVEEEEYE